MPRKHGTKGGKKTQKTLSLFEFNQNVGVGADPQLADLPSAPKAAEDWEAEGGRPEYNSRGYRERSSNSTFGARSRFDSNRNDNEDHDWTRRGPLEEKPSGNNFGMGGADRDWSEVRRGPLEDSKNDTPQRNWNDVRRGPVEASFDSKRNSDVDWTARKGPIEADRPMSRATNNNAWSTARGNAIEASFPETSSNTPQNWSRRKPVDAEIPVNNQEKDWGARRGPVESEHEKQNKFSWERKGPIEAELPQSKETKQVDWSARRAPVQSEAEKVAKSQKEVDFNDMRRGSRINELKNHHQSDKNAERTAIMEKDNWRRVRPMSSDKQSRNENHQHYRHSTSGQTESKEQDWGAARFNEPVVSSPPRNMKDEVEEADNIEKDANTPEQGSTLEEEDDWTTVRNPHRKTAGSSNKRGDGKNSVRRGGRQGSGNRREFTRPRGQIINKKTTTSPVTPPVTSAES